MPLRISLPSPYVDGRQVRPIPTTVNSHQDSVCHGPCKQRDRRHVASDARPRRGAGSPRARRVCKAHGQGRLGTRRETRHDTPALGSSRSVNHARRAHPSPRSGGRGGFTSVECWPVGLGCSEGSWEWLSRAFRGLFSLALCKASCCVACVALRCVAPLVEDLEQGTEYGYVALKCDFTSALVELARHLPGSTAHVSA